MKSPDTFGRLIPKPGRPLILLGQGSGRPLSCGLTFSSEFIDFAPGGRLRRPPGGSSLSLYELIFSSAKPHLVPRGSFFLQVVRETVVATGSEGLLLGFPRFTDTVMPTGYGDSHGYGFRGVDTCSV